MPRIIPRLLKALQNSAFRPEPPPEIPPALLPRKPRRSLWDPNLPRANFSPAGRTESVLLDEVNPLTHKGKFRRHKKMPPRVRVNKGPRNHSDVDSPRRMTVEERGWNANPYLRMLVSPLRRCFVTGKYLPSDFMIRVAPIRLPMPGTARPTQVVLPDGLHHTRFQARKTGSGSYVYCNRKAFEALLEAGSYRRLSTNVVMFPNIVQQIGHILRVRVLQELELLADRLQTRPRMADQNFVLRKLTRAEFKEFRNTGVIPYENAVALLILPPLNKDPITKKRPEPTSSSLPIQEGQIKPPARFSPPVSVLHPAQAMDDLAAEYLAKDNLELSQANIPLYNGVPLFPSRPQRAALYNALNRVLFVERRARWRGHGPLTTQESQETLEDKQPEDTTSGKRSRGDQKASHAYLLCSDAGTMLRADSAPLAIAFWRLRMWEDVGSIEGANSRDSGWRISIPKRLPE